MTYEAERLAATLKAAREKKTLSQRTLSVRAGVPQSHISKIEHGKVNLTVSSLTAIAHALDLELALVPRKAMPAVNSITRSVDDVPQAPSDVRKEISRVAKQLNHIRVSSTDPSGFEDLNRQFRELRQYAHLIANAEALRGLREALNECEESGGHGNLRDITRQVRDIRNALAHGSTGSDRPGLPRPAYRLDEDNDE